MKITAKYNNHSFYTQKAQHNSAPSFGIRFKAPKLLTDIFVKSRPNPAVGITEIKKVRGGEFGTECKNSIPLKNFEEQFESSKLAKLKEKGISTNTEGWSDSFLKSSADNPISTSSVYDCSVMYLFNKDTNTHFLYHSYFNNKQDKFNELIKTFMPEGFSNADILPGSPNWYKRHAVTMPEMLKAIKENNKNAVINIRNYSSKMPEVVGYKGQLFEIPNFRISMGFNNKGQASFKICDLKAQNLMEEIEDNATTPRRIAIIRYIYEQMGLDNEVLKIINTKLDQILEKLLLQNSK